MALDLNQRSVALQQPVASCRAQHLLHRWSEMADDYARLNDDVLGWQCEQTLVGLLTAAAWCIGWQGLVEISSYRQRESDRRSAARLDAWLRDNSGNEWYLEAKKKCLRTEGDLPFINEWLSECAQSAGKIDLLALEPAHRDRIKFYGLVFIELPFCNPAGDAASAAQFARLVEVSRRADHLAIGWSFPQTIGSKPRAEAKPKLQQFSPVVAIIKPLAGTE